ncbi:hypothetical protein [Candidatus Mycoplasma haematobovis]|nr:hypothetical protein [Candidatus Mycoplasma haematobovis]
MEITLQEIYSTPTPPRFKSYFSVRDIVVFDLQNLKRTATSFFRFLKYEFLHKLKVGRATNFFEEELFDSGTIARKYEADYLFLEKVQRYTLFPKYDGVIFPFDNTYEKLYFGISLFEKFIFKFRQKIEFFPSDPFEDAGHSHFFEVSELWRPEKCPHYLNLITEEVKRKFSALEKAVLRFNADIFETYDGDFVVVDNDEIRLGKLNKKLRKEDIYEKGIPKVEIEYEEPRNKVA